MILSGISNTPFHKHQQETTLADYARPTTALIAMLLRPKTTYTIPISPSFHNTLSQFLSDLAGDKPDIICSALHQVLNHLWHSVWIPTSENPIPDPTQRYLALVSLQHDGGFTEPHRTTGPIAKFEYALRLFMLVEMHDLVLQSLSPDLDHACSQLQPWFTEKINTPFNTLRSLQHRASALSYATPAMPRIWWLDPPHFRSLLYAGDTIHLDQLYYVFEAMEQQAYDLFQCNILLGLDLHIDYSTLCDDLTNTDVNYSFLSDPRNKCFLPRDRLLAAILQDDPCRTRFLVFDSRSRNIIWNKTALRQWLLDYAKLEGILLARCEMLAGSPGRSTELTSMTFCNTAVRPSRNLYVLGSHVSMVRRYHKSSSLTGIDKLIPHSLDAFTADLLIQDLAIARPFADIAVQICFPGETDILYLYRNNIFINNMSLFSTTDVTQIMSDFTLPFLGVALGINPWRHIHVAWKRKLCSAGDALLSDDRESVVAAQTGHKLMTANRIYGLTGNSLPGFPEDILPEFLTVSLDWHRECRVVPGMNFQYCPCVYLLTNFPSGGQFVPYFQARSIRFHDSSPMPSSLPLSFSTYSEDRIANKVVDKLTPLILSMLSDPQHFGKLISLYSLPFETYICCSFLFFITTRH